MTYHFGLIGFPLGHSLSPLIHTRIMDIAGIKGEYRLYELEPRRLKVELPKLLQALDGLNCTIPHTIPRCFGSFSQALWGGEYDASLHRA